MKLLPFHRQFGILFFCLILLLLIPVLTLLAHSGSRWSRTTASTPVREPVHYRDRILILMYHHIDPNEKDMTISPERFAEHMRALQQDGYHVIGIDQLLRFALSDGPVPDNAVVITFDDGYESFYRYAYPVLQKYHFPAANFIIVKATDAPDPKALPHLTWKEMRRMKQEGMGFFSHTYDQHHTAATCAAGNPKPVLAHRIFLRNKGRLETEAEYRERVRHDLALADERLESELGPQPRLLAFPYGAYNDTVVDIGRSLGIKLFFTTMEGINERHRILLYRVNAGEPRLSGQGLLDKLHRYDQKPD